MERKYFILMLGLLATVVVVLGWVFRWEGSQEGDDQLTLFGNVDVRRVALGFRTGGRLSALHFEEGDRVSPGDLLAQIDPEVYQQQLVQVRERVNRLEAQLLNLQSQWRRRHELLSTLSISEEEVNTLELEIKALEAQKREAEAAAAEAQIRVEDCELYAVQDGIILSRIQEPGSIVAAGEPVFAVTIPSPVWIRTFVNEPDLGRLRPGMKAEVITDTESNPIYTGQVGFISPQAEFTPKSVETTSLRTDLVYQVRIVVLDADGGLRQGMPVTVRVRL